MQGSVRGPTDAPWNAVSAFPKCGRAVAHVRDSYAFITISRFRRKLGRDSCKSDSENAPPAH